MPQAPPRASVVIANRNGMRHLEECFASLAAQSFEDYEIVVVDNASTDESVQWIRTHAPQATVIVHDQDEGYSASANDGIRAARGEYIIMLNNDVRLDPEWLGALVSAMDEHPDFDFGASLMILYYEPELTNAAGDVYSLREVSGANRGWCQPIELFSEPKRVLGACGGAVVYRRNFFDDVGLYDEDFYLIHEDTDINLRALIAGKRCLYIPGARVYHKFRSTGDQYLPDRLARLDIRNRWFVASKDLPLRSFFYCLYRVVLRDTLPLRPSKWHLIPGLIKDLSRQASPMAEGIRMGWAKRRDVWSRRKVSIGEIRCWLSDGVADL
ncbi:MAG: glycosyltransferase family 2 protein [Coriobacteriia bacterium]|nr:glycosyltransferase family 2 protein [Coriobacteriia bacterium]